MLSSDEKRMCREVLEECKTKGFITGRNRYLEIKTKKTKPSETRSPETLLMPRMAICCLEHKDIHKYRLVVISLHNYSKRTGKGVPENFAYLLFDFLSKIEAPVLIAGDFNFDIKKVSSLKKFVSEYSIEEYEINPLRKHLPKNTQRIDFIWHTWIYNKATRYSSTRPPSASEN